MSTTAVADTGPRKSDGWTRRGVIRAGLAATALVPIVTTAGAAFQPSGGTIPSRLWLLGTPSDLRPNEPSAPSQAEKDELLALRAERTDAMLESIARWGERSAVLPWTDVTLELIREFKPSPPRAARALALVHTALSDAVMAAEDARGAYQRPGPATLGDEHSFPSEHAAVAGVAATVLAYLFPGATERLTEWEDEAGHSRLAAGANYRSDIESGATIGRAIGQLAISWADADGSDATWDGIRPEDEGLWQPTPSEFRPNPVEPMAGTWRTWVLESGDAMRPPPPPTWGSEAWRAELAAVQTAVAQRTPEQDDAVLYWAGEPGTVTPAGLWVEIGQNLIQDAELDALDTANVLATTTVAMYDAFVCCWDAKFAYWMARPITADPDLDVLIPTPPFPSYTSGHSTVSAAAAKALGHFFPSHADELEAQAEEAKNSRLWAGIHFPVDNEIGASGGANVARIIIEAGE